MQPRTKELVTAAQVNTLMGVLNQLTHSVSFFSGASEDGECSGGLNDGGAKCALEASMMGVCQRLDILLAESSRWGVDDVEEFQRSIKAIQEKHLNVLARQQEALRVMNLPSIKLRPALSFIDGCWVAVYGEAGKLENRVVGLGNTPVEAMQDFDKAFGEAKPQFTGLGGMNEIE
jgi:hypothetical protein